LFKKSGENDTSNKGPSAETVHVLWRAQNSPQTREARSLEKKTTFPACDADSVKHSLCSKLRRHERCWRASAGARTGRL